MSDGPSWSPEEPRPGPAEAGKGHGPAGAAHEAAPHTPPVPDREASPESEGEEGGIFAVSKGFVNIYDLPDEQRREYASKMDEIYERGISEDPGVGGEDLFSFIALAGHLGFKRGATDKEVLEDAALLKKVYPQLTDVQLATIAGTLPVIEPKDRAERERLQRAKERVSGVVGDETKSSHERVMELSGDPFPSEERLETLGSLHEIIDEKYDKESLSVEETQDLLTLLHQNNVTQEEAGILLETAASELSADARKEIVEKLQKKSKEPGDDEALPEEKVQEMKATGQAMSEELEKHKGKLSRTLEGASERVKHRLHGIEHKIEHWQHKIKEFLDPDEPVKTWFKRGRLVIWWSLLISFMALMGYMALLNKVGRSK